MPELVIMKWKGDNAIRSKAIRHIDENGSLNPGGQVTGLNEAARQHHGKSSGLNPEQTPGAGPIDNTRGNRGSIRNRNAPHLHSATRLRNTLGEQ